MEIRIRPLQRSDLPSIKEINASVQPFPWSVKALEEELDYAPGLRFAAYDLADQGQTALGYIFLRNGGSEWELMSVGVAKNSWRRGIGRKLILFAIDHLVEMNEKFDALNLEVSHLNASALSLYKSLGFIQTAIRPDYYSPGVDAVCMKLRLAKP